MIKIAAREQAKIWNWVDLCPQEISGLGTVIVKAGEIYVDKVFLLDQEVSATETELDPQSVVQLMNTLSREDADRLKFWWHSHVNMGVFWSGTDERCISNLLGTTMVTSVVYNKKRQLLGRLDSAFPLYSKHDGLPVEFDTAPYEDDIIESKIMQFLDLKNPTPDQVYELMIKDGGNPADLVMQRLMGETLDFCKSEYEAKVRTKAYSYKGGYWRGTTSTKKTTKDYDDYYDGYGSYGASLIGFDGNDEAKFTDKDQFGQAWLWGVE